MSKEVQSKIRHADAHTLIFATCIRENPFFAKSNRARNASRGCSNEWLHAIHADRGDSFPPCHTTHVRSHARAQTNRCIRVSISVALLLRSCYCCLYIVTLGY